MVCIFFRVILVLFQCSSSKLYIHILGITSIYTYIYLIVYGKSTVLTDVASTDCIKTSEHGLTERFARHPSKNAKTDVGCGSDQWQHCFFL